MTVSFQALTANLRNTFELKFLRGDHDDYEYLSVVVILHVIDEWCDRMSKDEKQGIVALFCLLICSLG